MTLNIIFIVFAIIALIIGFFETRSWQKMINIIAISGIIIYMFRINKMPKADEIIISFVIVVVSISLAIFQSTNNNSENE